MTKAKKDSKIYNWYIENKQVYNAYVFLYSKYASNKAFLPYYYRKFQNIIKK